MGKSSDSQVVLVTGGTRGIGAAVSRAFLAGGATVWATGQTGEEVEACRKLACDWPGADRLHCRSLDLQDADAITELIGQLPQLDVLVNCAGMILRGGEEFDPEKFQRVLDVNLTGTMRMCTACRPLLAESSGCIVNLASMLSFFGSGFVPAYSASKGGIAQLTKSLAIAWAGEGIRVNAVAPGWIRTPLTQALQDCPERSAAILNRTPLARWGEPEDVVGPILFLCSPEARFITGTILPVDGGYSIM